MSALPGTLRATNPAYGSLCLLVTIVPGSDGSAVALTSDSWIFDPKKIRYLGSAAGVSLDLSNHLPGETTRFANDFNPDFGSAASRVFAVADSCAAQNCVGADPSA